MNGELCIISTAQRILDGTARDERAESEDRRNAFVALMAELGAEVGPQATEVTDAFISPVESADEAGDLTDGAHLTPVVGHAIAESAAPRPHRAQQSSGLPEMAAMVGTQAGSSRGDEASRRTARVPLDAGPAGRAPAHQNDAMFADATVIVGDGSEGEGRPAGVAERGAKAPPGVTAQQSLAGVRGDGLSLTADGLAAEDGQPAHPEAHRSDGVRASRATASATSPRGDLVTTQRVREMAQATPAMEHGSATVKPSAQAPGPRTESVGPPSAPTDLRSLQPDLLERTQIARASGDRTTERMQSARPSTARTDQPADARSRMAAPAHRPSATASAYTIGTGDAQFGEGRAGAEPRVDGPRPATPAQPHVTRQTTAEEMTLRAVDRQSQSPPSAEQAGRETRPETGRPVHPVSHDRRQSIPGRSDSVAGKTDQATADAARDSQIRSAEPVRVSPTGAEFNGAHRAAPTSDGSARAEPVISIRGPSRVSHATLTAERPQYLTLNIDPPELGRCELELSLHDGRIRATIVAERPETALTLRAVEGQVREQLAARDLQIAEFDVRAGTGSADQEAGQDMGGGHWRPLDLQPPPAQRPTPQLSPGSETIGASMHDGTIDLMA
ncbi:MAG: flagellar hook-length control protein FliK [Armatimonadota bacterium]